MRLSRKDYPRVQWLRYFGSLDSGGFFLLFVVDMTLPSLMSGRCPYSERPSNGPKHLHGIRK